MPRSLPPPVHRSDPMPKRRRSALCLLYFISCPSRPAPQSKDIPLYPSCPPRLCKPVLHHLPPLDNDANQERKLVHLARVRAAEDP
jgi:hypothetical protein